MDASPPRMAALGCPDLWAIRDIRLDPNRDD